MRCPSLHPKPTATVPRSCLTARGRPVPTLMLVRSSAAGLSSVAGSCAAVALCATLWGTLFSCVAVRVARPAVAGHVLDARSSQPVSDAAVRFGLRPGYGAKVHSGRDGRFLIPGQTYRELTWPGCEAPPTLIDIAIEKPGYCRHAVRLSNPRGGSIDPPWKLEVQLQPAALGCPKP